MPLLLTLVYVKRKNKYEVTQMRQKGPATKQYQMTIKLETPEGIIYEQEVQMPIFNHRFDTASKLSMIESRVNEELERSRKHIMGIIMVDCDFEG